MTQAPAERHPEGTVPVTSAARQDEQKGKSLSTTDEQWPYNDLTAEEKLLWTDIQWHAARRATAVSEPAAPVDARDALTNAQILKIAQQPETCPCYPWWLIGNVKVGDLQTAVLSFARAVLARQAAAPAEGVK